MVLIAVTILLWRQGRQTPEPEWVQAGSDRLYIEARLKTTFHCQGRLLITNLPGQAMLPVPLQMVVMEGKMAHVMKSMGDFRGRVSIAEARQALEITGRFAGAALAAVDCSPSRSSSGGAKK